MCRAATRQGLPRRLDQAKPLTYEAKSLICHAEPPSDWICLAILTEQNHWITKQHHWFTMQGRYRTGLPSKLDQPSKAIDLQSKLHWSVMQNFYRMGFALQTWPAKAFDLQKKKHWLIMQSRYRKGFAQQTRASKIIDLYSKAAIGQDFA